MVWSSTLVEAISATQTIVRVADAPEPFEFPYDVRIGDEILRCTGRHGRTRWLVDRGVNETTPAEHAAGAAVERVVLTVATSPFGDGGGEGPGGEHPSLATHTGMGLAPAHAHPYAADDHDHDGDYAAPHGHPYAADDHGHDTTHDHDGDYAGAVHGHAQADVTALEAALDGKAGTGHNHAGVYSPAGHAHTLTDPDIPASIARDSEITSAIAAHVVAETHGGAGAGIPAGIICMWSGTLATLPSGWALCDGSNGTPDLRDRFIVGAASGQDPGATGGAATHGHTVTQPADHAALSHAGATVADHAALSHSAHAGATVGDHAALSHSAHAGATVANHTDVVNHTHPENMNGATTGGLTGWGVAVDTSTNTPTATGYVTGNPSSGGVAAQVHTVGQASAHSDHGTQAHSVGQASAHSDHGTQAHTVGQASNHAAQSHTGAAVAAGSSMPPFYALALIMKL